MPKADILIAGFIKCGQESLERYYYNMDDTIKTYRDEFITKPNARQYYDNFGWETDPAIVVITRDPVDRCWSAYHYFRANQFPNMENMTYEEYLLHKSFHSGWGETNPIYMSNYERHIAPFRDLNISVLKLEDILGPEFPHRNTNTHTTMSDHDRKLTERLLEEEYQNPMTPTESPNCDKCGNGKNTEWCRCDKNY